MVVAGIKKRRMSALLKYMSVFTVCSVFAALISFVWQAFLSLQQLNKTTTLLVSLLAIEASYVRPGSPRIAVGYGACTDLLISATEFLNYSDTITARTIGPEFTVNEVNDERELLQTFAYYFQNGAAAERVMPNSQLFRKLVGIAKSRHRDSIRWVIGGNAPLMGIRFHQEACDVLLSSRMSEKLRRLLPSQMRVAGDLIPEDDIHIILEYKAGDRWGPFKAPRANRYILHNDRNNPYLKGVEKFDSMLYQYKPRLLVLSGFQMMDSYKFPKGVREQRLRLVERQVRSQRPSTLQHFEMASYVELELLQLLRRNVLPHVDSLGMNEQELDNLHQVLQYGRTAYASDWNPRVATTLDQMRKVFQLFASDYHDAVNGDASQRSERRLLSRIHVHTLAYQALLVAKSSQWHHTKEAAAKAAMTAHRYVCETMVVDPESASLVLDDSFATSVNGTSSAGRMKITVDEPVPCWDETIAVPLTVPALGKHSLVQNIDIQICVAPVLVCRVAKKTAGAGDNISAAALSLQI